MDNNQSPINSAGPQPTSPVPNPPASSTIDPVSGPVPVPSPEPTPPTGDVILEAGKKKRKKGLIAAIISIVAVLLIGGGAFAAAYIINNQPTNIIASAMDNLAKAKNVAINGTIDFSLTNGELLGVDSVNITLDDQNTNIKNSATVSIKINFANSTDTATINLGEVMLENGVVYLKADGLEDLYNSTFRDTLKTTLLNQIIYSTQNTTLNNCYSVNGTGVVECVSETTEVVAVDPAVEAAVNQAIDEILNQINSTVASLDGQWLEISISNILNSEMLGNLSSSTRQSITNSYNCTISTLNNTSNYTDEMSELYQKNAFINMTSGQNSFYNISFDATKLAEFLNGVPKTKFASDLAACYNTSISTNTTPSITADNISQALNYFPTISAKFDGIFNHHLTELKLTGHSDYYNLSADLKFSYPDSVNISTPNDYRPVMDVVEEVYQKLESLSSVLYAM